MKKKHSRENLRIAMLGHKRIPSREGGIEIVVEELATRMAKKSHSVTCYNRKGHNVAGSEFDGTKLKTYKGVTSATCQFLVQFISTLPYIALEITMYYLFSAKFLFSSMLHKGVLVRDEFRDRLLITSITSTK